MSNNRLTYDTVRRLQKECMKKDQCIAQLEAENAKLREAHDYRPQEATIELQDELIDGLETEMAIYRNLISILVREYDNGRSISSVVEALRGKES